VEGLRSHGKTSFKRRGLPSGSQLEKFLDFSKGFRLRGREREGNGETKIGEGLGLKFSANLTKKIFYDSILSKVGSQKHS
jgi:hypothetical protein